MYVQRIRNLETWVSIEVGGFDTERAGSLQGSTLVDFVFVVVNNLNVETYPEHSGVPKVNFDI